MENKNLVMIVDDDKFLLDMYKKKFESRGIMVEVATGSEEALDRLRKGMEPDALVLDVIMPKMDGIELLETIRKEKLASKSAVIMLTNESDPERIAKAKILGAKGYIVKATSIPSEVVDEVTKIANLKIN